ncbi:hypothetical protein [Methylobacterium sp. WSM2598]|uniref:hypothetical protein n=1 Tax=Methylobacterium sp. WSM2598 TaxID=398261 RepID=UPI00037679E9|nr:hypothetical protein [Methylobacterium sp. WSM2598]
MSKRTTLAQTLALKAAAAVTAVPEEVEAAPSPAPELPPAPPVVLAEDAGSVTVAEADKPRRGRPRGRREVANRQTVYLDEARYAALVRLADDRGRSVHSLIIEGIDHVIGKPVKTGWQ